MRKRIDKRENEIDTLELRTSGRKRKMGFGRKEKGAFSVHRSEEVVPSTLRHLVRQSSSLSSSEGGEGAGGGSRTNPANAGSSSKGSRSASGAEGPSSVESNDVDGSRDKDG